MNTMKLVMVGLAVTVLAGAARAGQDLVLASGGKARYAIIIDREASDNVRFAAWDLARLINQITGAEFAVCESGSVPSNGLRRIEVGTKAGQKKAGVRKMAQLGRESSLSMSCANGDILLLGKDDYGVTGAVYDFLEKQLGCRWYTAFHDERIPKCDKPSIKPFSCLVNPPFESRWVLTVGNMTCAMRDGDLALFRNGMNMTGFPAFRKVSLPEGCQALSCSYAIGGSYSHSLFEVIPPHGKQDYFGRHPEWFSFVKGKNGEPGKRVDNRHLCFSNRELRGEYMKIFLGQVDARGMPAGIYGISARDIPGPMCECEGCQALVAKYGTHGAPLFDFLAEVAAELKVRHPKAVLSTLAYRREQTQRPPNSAFPRFPSNVLVVFAPIDDDFSKDMSHPHNRDTLVDLANWRKFADHVWAWYYPLTYGSINPSAGIRRSARDIRLMRDAGLTGTGFEHDVGRDCGANFYDMHLWVMAKLFREPDLDEEKLVKTFCADYYGAAAPDVWRYWDGLERMREDYSADVSWDGSYPLAYTPATIAEWTRTMDAAERKVAQNDRLLQHVREARLGLDRLVLARYPNLKCVLPQPVISAEALRDRLTNTYCRCALRRNRGYGEKDVERVQTLYMLAGADNLKPVEFAGVPDEDLRQSFAFYPGSGCKRRPEADSCIGQACWYDEESKSGKKDYRCIVHDVFGKKTLLSKTIRNSEMVEGKFHFYGIGRIRLTPSCYIELGSGWHVLSSLSDLYMPGVDEEWDVYLSIKFEGPQYFPDSPLKVSRAVFDRTVLVRIHE